MVSQGLPVIALGGLLGPPPVYYGAMTPGPRAHGKASTGALVRTGTLSIRPPKGWVDTSQCVLTRPGALGGALLMVARERLLAGEDLRSFALRKRAWLGANVEALEVIENRPSFVAHREAHTLRYRFDSTAGRIEQRTTLIDPAPDSAITTVSAISLEASSREMEKSFAMFLETVRVDDSFEADDLASPRRRLRSMSFERLPGWSDATTLAFQAPSPPAGMIVVGLEPVRSEDPFEDHVGKKIAGFARSSGAALLGRVKRANVGGREASTLRFSVPTRELEETMVLVDAVPGAERSIAIFSSVGPAASRALRDEALDALLESARFDGGAR